MSEKLEDGTGFDHLTHVWTDMFKALWGPAAEMWQKVGQWQDPLKHKEAPGRVQSSWSSTVKSWQALFAAASEPLAMEALMKMVPMVPDIMLKFAQTGLQGFVSIQEQLNSRLEKMGASSEPFNFEELDRELLSRMREVYEKEIRRVLNMPQVGLSRLYQERALAAVDKFNLFQAALGEFLHQLYLPMEKSYRTLQEEVARLAEAGQLPEDAKAYYQMWIKILEGHYMTLYKSPEYTETLGKTLSALNGWVAARREVLADALQALPVVTHREMNELYKEIYQLKKQVKSLNKQLKAHDGKPKA